MSVAKLSVSLPEELVRFVESYRKRHGLNRLRVFEEAVNLLRSHELESAYRQANTETDKEWEKTVAEGINDEVW